jgi:hypothetical protein
MDGRRAGTQKLPSGGLISLATLVQDFVLSDVIFASTNRGAKLRPTAASKRPSVRRQVFGLPNGVADKLQAKPAASKS